MEDAHRMRITSGGDMAGYVKFALSFLRDNDRPLVLHTLPPDEVTRKGKAGSSSSSKGDQEGMELDDKDEHERNGTAVAEDEIASRNDDKKQEDKNNSTATNAVKPSPKPKPLRTPSTLQACTLATPRLVSVVEKIKREFGGELWQYTESGVLPSPKEPVSLERVLSGKTKPKMTHRAYLQITVSKVPLGLETGRNVTCQHVKGKRVGDEEAEGRNVVDSLGTSEATSKLKDKNKTESKKSKSTKRKSDAVPPATKRARVAA